MKPRTLLFVWLAAATGFVVLPTMPSGERGATVEANEVAEIAEQFVAKRYPDFDKTNKKLVIKETETNWEVTYQLPDDMIGGAPVVVIDKKSKTVIRSYRTQ
jgi:NTF2 fold immunity protein of polymorphic toxin system component